MIEQTKLVYRIQLGHCCADLIVLSWSLKNMTELSGSRRLVISFIIFEFLLQEDGDTEEALSALYAFQRLFTEINKLPGSLP